MTRVREAFKAEGFGVLTEIDVQATLKQKLNEDMPRYLILGMCNPSFAHRAIGIEPTIGLLLPCNVVVREEGGQVLVGAQDPEALMRVVGDAKLEPVGREVAERVRRAMDAALA